MGVHNISIFWGPNLLESSEINGGDADDVKVCSMIMETIISNVSHIFEV